VIGSDVWLGNGVFVRASSTIGDGVVIGARSVVVADIPPYAIAVGHPRG
jgi:chloramphenicol O-acetyltransferase type B